VDRSEARQRLQALWTPAVETNMGCEMYIDDALTEEHSWGWVFYFVPRQPEQCQRPYKRRAFAFHRVSGDSIPVGTKGLEGALLHLRPQ
jgi:hypothetical protein